MYGHRNQTSIAYGPSMSQGVFTLAVFSGETREAVPHPRGSQKEKGDY